MRFGERCELLSLMLGHQRIGQFFQIAVHHHIEFIQCQIDPVVRNASLRKIIGADAFAAVTRTDQ